MLPAAVRKDSCRKVCRSSPKPWPSRIPAASTPSSFCVPYWLAHPFQPIRGLPMPQTHKIALRPFSQFDVRCSAFDVQCCPAPSLSPPLPPFAPVQFPFRVATSGFRRSTFGFRPSFPIYPALSGLIPDKNYFRGRSPCLQKQKITKRTHFAILNSIITTITYVRPVRYQAGKRTHFPPSNLKFPSSDTHLTAPKTHCLKPTKNHLKISPNQLIPKGYGNNQ